MEQVIILTLLSLAFFGTHVGLATGRMRAGLVARLGELGFTVLYSVLASLLWVALIAYYAAHRFDGPPGLALGATVLRWPLIAMVVAGVVLLATTLVAYPALPSSVGRPPIRAPRGVERITRHPLFAGIALLNGAHALLATRLVGTVFAVGLALLGVVGAWHQDQKLRARRGPAFEAYLATTSAIPFAAIVAGRQRLVWSELPLGVIVGGLVGAVLLRIFHDQLFAIGGLWVIVAVIGFAGVAGWQSLRVARRAAAAPRRAPYPDVALQRREHVS